jgi:hypothetical protein
MFLFFKELGSGKSITLENWGYVYMTLLMWNGFRNEFLT